MGRITGMTRIFLVFAIEYPGHPGYPCSPKEGSSRYRQGVRRKPLALGNKAISAYLNDSAKNYFY
jgi:hypothetical protein